MRRVALVLAVCAATAGNVRAQLTHLWHYEGQASGPNWRSVAIGASGSQIVSNLNGGSGAIALMAGSEVPSSPLIWSDNTSASARMGLVQSADQADKYASIYFESVPAVQGTQFIPKLTLRRSSSPASLWTRTFNSITAIPESMASGLHVSSIGSRIFAWWFDISQARTFFVAYSDAGALVFAVSMPMPIPPQASAMNADGSRLFVVCNSTTLVLDGATGSVIKTIGSWYNPTAAFAADDSGDCAVIGNATGAVDVYRTGSTLLAGAYSIPGVGTLLPREAAVSADGSTLVVGYRSTLNVFSWTVRIYALGTTGATQLFETSLAGAGAFTTLITDIVASRNGDIVAFCTSGDELHNLPSLVALRRAGVGYTAIGNHTLSGSAYDMDLSADGRLLAVVSSLNHYQASTQTGVIDAFDLGGDLAVTGVPHAGTSVLIEQQATPGIPCMLLRSETLSLNPVHYAGMGSLLLDSWERVAVATADAQGVARFQFPVPAGAANYGRTYYTQGVTLIQRKLTKSYVPITVVP